MTKLTLQRLHLGDKYNIMGNATKDFLQNSAPVYDERTEIELLIIKHTTLITKKMKHCSDYILDFESEM
ncbi:hypothetical protein [Chakrabartyella piscis]|uniref:hypothetical protein n=1 Tax=Chakrabartyella piscis TaxID=2918914 RepID=UPI00295833B9|nr:hypothetical protein [Chakrabartyella piscis]